MARTLVILILSIAPYLTIAQRWYEPSDTLNKKRALLVGFSEGATYVSTLGGLQFAWYNEYQNSKFHFFNDWAGWQQMDKVGHSVTAYQAGYNLYKINKWAGIPERKSMWYAVGLSYSYQLAVEVMDGFSTGWGFSNYDLLFNTIGSGAFLSQQLAWKEQRIKLKFSFWPSGLTNLPAEEGRRARNLYGEELYEQWLKDYNGQTYWASLNLWSLTGKSDKMPKWLNLAVGYSANNLLGAESNTWQFHDYPAPTTSNRIRQRQFLLSLDIDLQNTDLPKALVWLKPVFGIIKLPFPALEYNTQKGFVGHWLYF